jgi:hypothetical protein
MSKMNTFWMYFGMQIGIMFWVEFDAENRPKRESFGVDFTLRGKHIPKQEDMFGCHILVPKIFRPPL